MLSAKAGARTPDELPAPAPAPSAPDSMDVEAPPPAEAPAAAPAADEEGSVAVGAVGVPAVAPAPAPAPAAETPRDAATALAALEVQVDEAYAAKSPFSQMLLKVAQVVRLVEGERDGYSDPFSDAEWILMTSLGDYFRNSMLPLKAGSSLRLFLATLLNRVPDALTKKFTAEEMELGKQTFVRQAVDPTVLEKVVRTRRDQVEAFVVSQRDPQVVSRRGRPSSQRSATEFNTARSGYRNSSTPIKHEDLPPLNTIPPQENPSYDSVLNFDRRTSDEKRGGTPNWCVRCGKPEGTGDGCVKIRSHNKDVCTTCANTFRKHNESGVYFKWCNGKHNFQEIHAFAGKLTATKCDDERARNAAAVARTRSGSAPHDDPMEDSESEE